MNCLIKSCTVPEILLPFMNNLTEMIAEHGKKLSYVYDPAFQIQLFHIKELHIFTGAKKEKEKNLREYIKFIIS